MTRTFSRISIVLLVGALAACDAGVDPFPQENLEVAFDFHVGTHGWIAAFTDFPAGQEALHQVESGHRALPLPLDTLRRGFMLSGMNHSDDMFMYIRRNIPGLMPDAEYMIRFTVQLATDAPAGCAGVGGAPGESVVLKVGASRFEPKPVVEGGDYRLSVDKGEQMEEGSTALILGDLANSNEDCYNPRYELKDFESPPRRLRARTDGTGRIWLYVGTESGFEARTRVFITRVRVELERVS
jgi:hypothetical protein